MQDKANMSLTVTCYTYMCVHVCTSHVHVYLQYVLDSAAETTVQQKQNCMIFIYMYVCFSTALVSSKNK